MTLVKLCGMSRLEDVRAAVEARPDMIGFIVEYPSSHRSVSRQLLLKLIKELRNHEDGSASHIATVGVFVDTPPLDVSRIAALAKLDFVQLHGSEDAAYIKRLRKTLPETCRIIQAFQVSDAQDLNDAVQSLADLILLDSGQGSGETFDWSVLAGATRPFILAGGLGPDTVAQAISKVHPYGVDMSSGIETNKHKDPAKMLAAVRAVRTAATPVTQDPPFT